MLKNKIANRFVIYLNVTKWNLYEEISMFMINKLIKNYKNIRNLNNILIVFLFYMLW
ncbi:protein of unknown function [Clostridium beijerinckii]|nr:protein of unknown function [Clostridium beijerinckii]